MILDKLVGTIEGFVGNTDDNVDGYDDDTILGNNDGYLVDVTVGTFVCILGFIDFIAVGTIVGFDGNDVDITVGIIEGLIVGIDENKATQDDDPIVDVVPCGQLIQVVAPYIEYCSALH